MKIILKRISLFGALALAAILLMSCGPHLTLRSWSAGSYSGMEAAVP